jgi:transposase
MISTPDKQAEEALVTRTLRIPVAKVLEGGTRNEFYADLRKSMRACTAAVNRCLTECAIQDKEAFEAVGRGEKVPKSPKFYTYQTINDHFPGFAWLASTLSRMADKKYKAERFAIVTQQRSLPIQRNCAYPLKHSAKQLRAGLDSDGNVLLSIRLLSGTAYLLRLRGGSNYRKPLRAVREAIEHERIGDSQIWIDKKGMAVVGLACKLPKIAPGKNVSGVLAVRTVRDAFLVASREHDKKPFTINADHVKRWLAERGRRQGRLRQDRKSGTARRNIRKKQAEITEKFNCRIDSFIEETTAHVVQHARRRRVEKIQYDSTIRSYFSDFPWYKFALRLHQKAEQFGLIFENVTSEILPATAEEPHVYCDLGIDRATNQIRNVKIGRSRRKLGVRAKDDARATDQDWITLFTHKTAAKSLPKLEKQYLSLFDAHRIPDSAEMFLAEPVIAWSREVGCLGNSGNLSQIQQYLET